MTIPRTFSHRQQDIPLFPGKHGLCSYTPPAPPSSHNDFSVLISAQHEEMQVKTGTLSLFTSKTVVTLVTCNNQKIDSYTRATPATTAREVICVKLRWPHTGRGTAYNTRTSKCSYLLCFQIIKPQHKGLTPQGSSQCDQCSLQYPVLKFYVPYSQSRKTILKCTFLTAKLIMNLKQIRP